jgi:hypothetical protein
VVGARRGAASVPQSAGAGDGGVPLRTTLYEVMRYWETADQRPSAPEHELEFARIWKDTPKVVFSKTLERVEGSARLVRDHVAEEAARVKAREERAAKIGCVA